MEIKFKTVKEMIMWLVDNEGKLLKDYYGRQWKYQKYKFFFKDIGTNDVLTEGISCLHLFETFFTCE